MLLLVPPTWVRISAQVEALGEKIAVEAVDRFGTSHGK
jgi:hypothetical protein